MNDFDPLPYIALLHRFNHELRNELNAIQRLTAPAPPGAPNLFDCSARRLLDLAAALQDLARWRETPPPDDAPGRERVPMCEYDEGERACLQFMARLRGVQIDFPPAAGRVQVALPRDVLRRLCACWLRAVLRRTPTGACVSPALNAGGGMVRLRVETPGGRMAAETLLADLQGDLEFVYTAVAAAWYGGGASVYADPTSQAAIFELCLPGEDRTAGTSADRFPQEVDTPGLDVESRERLKAPLAALRRLKTYQLSACMDALADVPTEPNDLARWRRAVEDAVFSGDEARFRKLLA